MYCPNCRNYITEGVENCPHCGTNLKQVKEESQNHQTAVQPEQPMNYNQNNIQQPVNNNQSGNNKKLPIIPIVIAILLIIVVVFGVSKFMKKDTPQIDNEQTQGNNNSNEKDNATSNNGNTTGTVDPNTILTYDKNGAFLMAIEDIFYITGRGTIVTGRIARGSINVNDEIQIIGLNHEIITTTVTGIEMFRQNLDYAEIGKNVGLILKDVKRDDIEKGQVLAKPNSIKAAIRFEANVNVLSKEEGGRHTPFFSGHTPKFNFRGAEITGTITLSDGVEMVKPGDSNVKMTVELVSNIAMEVGTEFIISEGDKTIGKGIVTKMY